MSAPILVPDTNVFRGAPIGRLASLRARGLTIRVSDLALHEAWARSVRDYQAGTASRPEALGILFKRAKDVASHLDEETPIAASGGALARSVIAEVDGSQREPKDAAYKEHLVDLWGRVVGVGLTDEAWIDAGREADRVRREWSSLLHQSAVRRLFSQSGSARSLANGTMRGQAMNLWRKLRNGTHATIGIVVAVCACKPAANAPDAGAVDDDASGGGSSSGASVGSGSGGDATVVSGSSTSGGDAASSGSNTSSSGDVASGIAGSDGGDVPPSCRVAGPGRTNCGTSSESCCTSLLVPGGTYHRSFRNVGSGPTDEADPATISSFRLDKYLVTVGRFRQFVAASGGAAWTPAPGSGKHAHLNGGKGLVDSDPDAGLAYEIGWLAADDANVAPTTMNLVDNCNATDLANPFATWTDTAASTENLPINCVNWWEAYAFCIWDGGFLPSEAEWEYAAGGGDEERQFAWGSTYPGTACPGTGCEYMIYNCCYPSGPRPVTNGISVCPGVQDIAPVGTAVLGAGRWGQLDMAGEMDEWLLDRFASYFDPCTDCAELTDGSGRSYRGGNFFDTSNSNTFDRGGLDPSARDEVTGLRCARTP